MVRRAIDAGIIKDKNAINAKTTPAAYAKAADAACSASLADVPKQIPGVPEDNAQFMCLDLSFQHSLLTKGMKLADDTSITVAKQVEYNGQNFEAAWPLGAAINTLSS